MWLFRGMDASTKSPIGDHLLVNRVLFDKIIQNSRNIVYLDLKLSQVRQKAKKGLYHNETRDFV